MHSLNDLQAIVDQCEFDGWQFRVKLDGDRPYLQVADPDGTCNKTGESLPWTGRKWFLSPHATKSEVVQTALKAVLTAVEHEARERFRYLGRPIFGPHFNVDYLWRLCGQKDAEDAREAN